MKAGLRVIFLLSCSCLFSSCLLFAENKKERLLFQDEAEKIVVRINVPKDYQSSMATIDSVTIRERYFTYANGAVLYVNIQGGIPSRNQARIDATRAPASKLGEMAIYKGQDPDGTHWKEIRNGSVRVGYLKVPSSQREKYENALTSYQARN
jgi:hypothetical protein